MSKVGCTWKGCDRIARISVNDADGTVRVRLCREHWSDLESALASDIKAPGGLERLTSKLLLARGGIKHSYAHLADNEDRGNELLGPPGPPQATMRMPTIKPTRPKRGRVQPERPLEES